VTTSGSGYRLPTEAEWEYACRAGTTTHFFTGDDPKSLEGYANVRDTSSKSEFPRINYTTYPCFPFNDRYPFTAPVGTFKPNPFGLYDMHGNVAEWCQDWYDRQYYDCSRSNDPAGPETGQTRVSRGGHWHYSAVRCRSASRSQYEPKRFGNYYGFRVLRAR
jgi:formylglycine-generating enzyme required for sulfatase activity